MSRLPHLLGVNSRDGNLNLNSKSLNLSISISMIKFLFFEIPIPIESSLSCWLLLYKNNLLFCVLVTKWSSYMKVHFFLFLQLYNMYLADFTQKHWQWRQKLCIGPRRKPILHFVVRKHIVVKRTQKSINMKNSIENFIKWNINSIWYKLN